MPDWTLSCLVLLVVVFESEMISSAIGRDPDVHWNVHITSKARRFYYYKRERKRTLSIDVFFSLIVSSFSPSSSPRIEEESPFVIRRPSLGLNLCDNNVDICVRSSQSWSG